MVFVKISQIFYQISLKILVYLTDFSPQFIACMMPYFENSSWFLQNNLERTDPSEIERTYNIRKQQSLFMRADGKCNNSQAP